MKTQEEIIMSMIHKFDDQFIQDKNIIFSDLEDLKSQLDILKISFTVNEKTLLDKIKMIIENEMRLAVKDTEKEVLMKFWIDDLKGIIKDFEKLKKANPREFKMQIREISNTIDLFKQKLAH